MNEFLARVWVTLSTLFAPLPARVRVTRQARGLTFIEYAILAGIIVAIGVVLATVFRPALENLWQSISDSLGNATR